jgi:hypothetical protein
LNIQAIDSTAKYEPVYNAPAQKYYSSLNDYTILIYPGLELHISEMRALLYKKVF